jgi:uncharacterized protein with ParB-like and HNH nuclease domain/alkylated DNA nucleotide flippase Atl1
MGEISERKRERVRQARGRGNIVKAGETTLRKLVQGEQQFVVPLYQRPYSWESGQLGRLWEDVLDQAKQMAAGQPATHFLGSIVLAPSPNLMPNRSQWIVVDGQQRLTTLMVALCALRDHQAAEDPAHIDRINELYLVNKWQQGDMRYRILPTQVDRSAMKACVDRAYDSQIRGLIGGAYQFFRGRLTAVDDPADPHDIARIEQAVLDQLSLVQIVVDKSDNAYRIFESLNNTGMRLSSVDLIRNYVFMCLPTRGEHVYQTYWLPLQERLGDVHGTKALELLMYLVLVLERGEETRYNDVYEGHQKLLDQAADDESRVEAYVKELARRAWHLELILDPDKNRDPRIADRLRFFNEWQAQTVYPTVMKLLELLEDGETSEDDVATALAYVESFLVRRLIAALPTNNLNRIFQRLTLQLSADLPDTVCETVRTALSPARMYWPTDDELRTAIHTKQFYWQGRQNQKKLVLRRLAATYPGGEPVRLEDKQFTIEHVLPQNLADPWRRELAADSEDPAMLHRQLVHTLGNLTLTAYNSELGDLPFAAKRERLRQSGVAMNQGIATQERWGKPQIQARCDDFADRASKIWPGPNETDRDTAPGRDWTLLYNALAALPPQTWTTYGDLAELIGSAPVAIGVHLATVHALNAHRVLMVEGKPSTQFRWPDEKDARDVVEVLTAEGISFDAAGRADPTQRMSARELAHELGLPGAEDIPDVDGSDTDAATLTEHEQRFHRQLGDRSGPRAAGAVARLLERWRNLGGKLSFGRSATARCTLILDLGGGRRNWMINLYPTDVEITFQVLMKRPPFDDPQLREELRQRLNDAPGLAIPAAKIDLYPNFPMTMLTDTATWDVVVAALDWFADQAKRFNG